MNRFLLAISLIIIIMFLVIRKNKLQEHFESNENKENKSIEDILRDLEIDLNKIYIVMEKYNSAIYLLIN